LFAQLDSNVAPGVNRWADYTDGTNAYNGDDTCNQASYNLTDKTDSSGSEVATSTLFNLLTSDAPATGIYMFTLFSP
jgi:hypothetical protein